MTLNLYDPQFVNSIIPYNMEYCFIDTCPKKDLCFRHIASKFKDKTKKSGMSIFPDALQEGKCNYFLKARIINAAWGFKGLYDQVKKQDILSLRMKAICLLGGRTSYYRYHRGEKKLTPEEQEAVKNLFERKGYPPPHYDHQQEMVDFINPDC